ncbi:hypothetical protein BCY91_03280 [Pelobium manganitolerans]|uniref:4-oxalocrotonate tautomerase n=1 Tax=Pelobium manganitolerans TaxID=1842495 RepID=A0A419S7N1_9SPHI|nr:tautomerase family protein [Pelobium manganitolerans]RKD17176.1 hypothetical protein BCY91_03280 [Pelobium manganitolerans]
MPSVLIEVRKEYSQEEEIGIMNAVHAALVAAFKIPPGDKIIRLVVHAPHKFNVPPAKLKPEYYTLVSIDAISGRSIEAKRKLYAGIVKNLEPFGIPNDHVMILLRESIAENWGIKGGKPASDVHLDFDVNV